MRHLLDSMEMEEKDVIKIVQPASSRPHQSEHGVEDGPMGSLRSLRPCLRGHPHLFGPTTKVDMPQTASAPALMEFPREIPEDQRLIPFVDVLFGGSLASVIICENCRAVSRCLMYLRL